MRMGFTRFPLVSAIRAAPVLEPIRHHFDGVVVRQIVAGMLQSPRVHSAFQAGDEQELVPLNHCERVRHFAAPGHKRPKTAYHEGKLV